MLWATAGVITLGFLLALQLVAHHLGIPGPITQQAREVIHAPKSGFLLYAGMALTMVVLTWRQRLIALGAAIGIDLVFLAVRWATGSGLAEDGHPFGNGALWVVLGLAVIALTRRTGAERLLLLKGVGLGLLLVTGRKTGDTWLLITSQTLPVTLDPYIAMADHALGNPSWLAGRLLEASGPVGEHALDYVYAQLAVAAVVVALYQLRHVAAEGRFPRHHLVRTFLVIGLVGPAIYMIYPVVGPMFAYGPEGGTWAAADLWPHTLPPVTAPYHLPFDEITPRNCMPSLHTAWATAIFIHSRQGPRALRLAGAFWLVATLAATLGFGWHYGVDLVAGVVFAYTIEAGLRTFDRGWDRAGILLVAYGTVVFAALLTAYRFAPLEMAAYPWLAGPLVLLVMASVVYGYRRLTGLWEGATVPAPRAEPQPEPA
ncbi:phosphatase PAP2 family protein [Streptomyces dubilierae]|uniref:Phosphatase PAP2 family protein n=1 Tax=Streptomyces dubilierae TaxID=3075533 RepID=A0ABU2PE37_9ACTN|nr:phosphatase PAP2 family protein [Streptomyces sp. DSM 41921]MDT0390432.1 phosphatase PAP2 family protein [Streptomyces sp. DSM 41921]